MATRITRYASGVATLAPVHLLSVCRVSSFKHEIFESVVQGALSSIDK